MTVASGASATGRQSNGGGFEDISAGSMYHLSHRETIK